MKSRMSIKEVEPKVYEAMLTAARIAKDFDIDPKLRELIKIRVSQINGCGYCLNMHVKDARKIGETDQRLDTLAAWWETPFFSDKEQAALKLAEEMTFISKQGITDSTYERAVQLFGEKGVAQLTLEILIINNWNRIAISTHLMPA